LATYHPQNPTPTPHTQSHKNRKKTQSTTHPANTYKKISCKNMFSKALYNKKEEEKKGNPT